MLVNIGYGPDEMSHLLVMDHMEYIIVMDTGYYWDNFGHRPDGMTLNDTIVMDIFWLWTTLNEYWLWTRYNETIVLDIGHESYGMPPLAWILIMDHLLVMDHINMHYWQICIP